jgi:hypothetical protein
VYRAQVYLVEWPGIHGPHGPVDRRDAVTATIWQEQDIQIIDGAIITADGFEDLVDERDHLGSDDFEFFL